MNTIALWRGLIAPLLPFASRWVEAEERRGLKVGRPLTRNEQADAAALGVLHPERVRLVRVERMSLPKNALLRRVSQAAGVLSPDAAGLCLRYAIFIRAPYWGDRLLLAHEMMHTAQYERLGGVRPFLRRYLEECLTIGYAAAPMEWEAIEGASRVCSE